MLGLAYGLLAVGLLWIVVEDVRERAISVWTLPTVFLAGLYIGWQTEDWRPSFLGYNAAFVGLQGLGVTLYCCLKHRRWVNITEHYLGAGDLWFFVAITPLFTPLRFCLFFVGALLLTLLGAGVYQWSGRSLATIPLAGSMSAVGLGYGLLLFLTQTPLYRDDFLVPLLYG